ncbi:hypothetical protein [Sphingomonas sp.]
MELWDTAGAYATLLNRLGDGDVDHLLEPVKTRIDHPGVLIDWTREAM